MIPDTHRGIPTLLLVTLAYAVKHPQLVGYYCDTSGTVAYSPLTDPEPCEYSMDPSYSTTNKTGTLIRENRNIQMAATICEYTQVETRQFCSYNRWELLDERQAIEEIKTPLFLDPVSCQKLMKGEDISIGNGPIHKLDGRAIQFRIDAHLSSDGYCSPYSTYFVKRVGTIRVRDISIEARFYSISRNATVFTTTGQHVSSSSPGLGLIDGMWPVVWSSSQLPTSQFSLVYHGTCEHLIDHKNHSIIMIRSRASAFQLLTTLAKGHLALFETSIPDMYWTFKDLSNETGANDIRSESLMDVALAGDNYGRSSISVNMDKLQLMTLGELCKLRKQILTNFRMILESPPHTHTGLILKDKLLKVTLNGEAIAAQPCEKVALYVRIVDTCYSKVPVRIQGNARDFFLAPGTREIVDHAAQIPCDDAFVPLLDLNGTFVKFTPRYQVVHVNSYLLGHTRLNLSQSLSFQQHLYDPRDLKTLRRPESYMTVEEKIRLSLLHQASAKYGQHHFDSPYVDTTTHLWHASSLAGCFALLLTIGVTLGCVVFCCTKRGRNPINNHTDISLALPLDTSKADSGTTNNPSTPCDDHVPTDHWKYHGIATS